MLFDSLIQSLGILLYVLDSLNDLLFEDVDSLFYGDVIILQIYEFDHLLILIFIFHLDLISIARTLKLRPNFGFAMISLEIIRLVFGTDRATRKCTGCLLAPVGFYHGWVYGVCSLWAIQLRMVFDIRKLLFCGIFGCC